MQVLVSLSPTRWFGYIEHKRARTWLHLGTDLIRLFTCGRTGANTVLNTDSQAGWSRSCKWMVETMIC